MGQDSAQSGDPLEQLGEALQHVAHLLPSQGPIAEFVHHNTLHALEALPFEEAVLRGARLHQTEPYLSEARYRRALKRGRIRGEDLHAVLDQCLGDELDQRVAGVTSRRELRYCLLAFGYPDVSGPALSWTLNETDALDQLRSEVPREATELFIARARTLEGRDVPLKVLQRCAVSDLWVACVSAIRRHDSQAAPQQSQRPAVLRHRDLLLQVVDRDADALTHPLLIRVCAAYLDQGVAYWPMPDRELGLYRAFLALYGRGVDLSPEPWQRRLTQLVRDEAAASRDAQASIQHSLACLGVGPAEWTPFLLETALALSGWAGMIAQVEQRPDRTFAHTAGASFAEFIAVRLIVERAALSQLAHEAIDNAPSLAELRPHLLARYEDPDPASEIDRAWPLFNLMQLLGCLGDEVRRLEPPQIAELLAELAAMSGLERRRLLHLAYERRYRLEVFDALSGHPVPPAVAPTPAYQAVFCIDEREESLRRHLEEVNPSVETFGAPGFFGVAMVYRDLLTHHARSLCPVAIRPQHLVVERPAPQTTGIHRRHAGWRVRLSRMLSGLSQWSRTLLRGTIITTTLGALASIPLLLRILVPRWSARLTLRGHRALFPQLPTRLDLRSGGVTAGDRGALSGFSDEQMATIVARLLIDIGLAGRLAPLVLVLGHGSSSLNNPHEAAYDCGACGGGRGGPNARALAQMANDPQVRQCLASQGVTIPDGCWFLGGEHNTASDAVVLFDEALVPATHRALLHQLVAELAQARQRNAHERSRRFDAAPSTPELALKHVEGRAEDLAQARPEYGHATNALCVIGRRARTRGLFLDRRAFLMSYDPTTDDNEGTILAGVLGAVLPVVAGINLEYFFSAVDPLGYGCGTKLPHNVSAMLGVMDGHQSDLRTGLTLQMVELHEPLRLLVVVECRPALLRRLIDDSPALSRLVSNHWIQLAALDPLLPQVGSLVPGGFEVHDPVAPWIREVNASADWYGGRHDHLPLARIRPVEEAR